LIPETHGFEIGSLESTFKADLQVEEIYMKVEHLIM
jgi:hypothetical protein